MKRTKSGRGKIDFGMRSSSGIGIVSSCMVGIEIFLSMAAVYFSYLDQGEGGMWLGAAGFAVFVLSVVGLVLGVYGMTRRGYYHRTDWFGMVGNGIVLIVICGLFVWGVMS